MPRTIGKLERGWVRHNLIADLAAMQNTQVELGLKYDCNQSSISEFAKRHADEIEAKKKCIEDELHGLWIASKAARLAEYQQTLDDIEDYVHSEALSDKAVREAVALKLKTLRQAADELGQLPQRTSGSGTGTTVTLQFDGVTVEDLR
jgi:hypothetical protein